ncbi:manganese efflux pump, partial [Clostridium tertium]|uniref:manganese efflux pump n=2 Tax=Clostridium TaxID=1485 RepID=UPI0034A30C7B
FKLFDFNVVLQVYADETKADFDKSKILTSKEALYLAFALSLDSLAVGFGSSLISINYIQVFAVALLIGIVAILLGAFIGKKFVETTNINLSWLSGAMLIILAFLRAF